MKQQNTEEFIEIKFLIGAGINAPHFLVHSIPKYRLPKFAFLMPLSTKDLILKYPLVSEQNGVVFKLAKTECVALMNWAYDVVSISL